jgi:hypothetical protein
MKHLVLIFGFLLSTFYSKGQDIIFLDKGDKESFSKLKDKTIRKEVATFTDAGSVEKKPNIKLSELPLSKTATTYSIFAKDSIFFKITVAKFNKANHKIKYKSTYAVEIDNKPIWGKDGDLPKMQISSIFVKIGKDTIIIPKSAYSDLFEPSLTGMLNVYYSKDRKRFYIAMGNGDGAGFYEATLIIQDKLYWGRVLDTGF